MDSSRLIIADLPVEQRPRERLARCGAEGLSDAELLAIVIEPGWKGRSSLDLARQALRYGIAALPLRHRDLLGPARSARMMAALELGRRFAIASQTRGDSVVVAASVGAMLVPRYADERQERLGAVYLDSRSRIIREREIYVGTVTTATVSTRDVFRFALEENAAVVIVFHNHPSGDPSQYAQDVQFTKRLVQAGNAIGIEVVDHIIVASQGYVSLKSRGVI